MVPVGLYLYDFRSKVGWWRVHQKYLLLLSLLLLSLDTSSATTQRKGTLCTALGGSCQQRYSGCKGRTLSSLCYPGAKVCCTPGRRDWLVPGVTIKRVVTRDTCTSNPKRCQKKGGDCQADSLPCDTLAVDRLCKAEACTCCLQNQDDKCQRKVGCQVRGGFCIRGNKKLCQKEGGQVNKKGCKGRKCSCCVSGNCSCGKANNRRIVGGWATVPPYKYPWLAGLKITGITDKYFCGGAIINNRFILSAAHCLYSQITSSPYDPDMLSVGIGDHNQVSTEDDLPGVTQLVKVEKIIVHNEYQFLQPEHDIGLIRLTSSIDLTSHPQVRAVCLPTDIYESYEGRIGMAYGWGVMEATGGEQPDIAREVGLTIWDDKCNGKTIGKVKITSQMLCAGEKEGGKDTCMGDSGGPLTVEENGVHVLVGITSFGSGCGEPDSPGVYTRVTEYLDWILDNTQGTSFCNN